MGAGQSTTVFGGVRRGRFGVVDAMPAARGAHVLAQELASRRIDQPDVEIIPLHVDAPADPAGRRAVVSGVDFDAAIEMDRADTESVVAKRLERQRPRVGFSSAKHRSDLPGDVPVAVEN
jgi:hypothetical protein